MKTWWVFVTEDVAKYVTFKFILFFSRKSHDIPNVGSHTREVVHRREPMRLQPKCLVYIIISM